MKCLILSLSIGLGLVQPALADRLFLETGSSFSNMNKVTKSDDGSKSLLGTHQFLFSIAGETLGFRPEVGYTIFGRKGADDSYTSRLLVIQAPYLINVVPMIQFKAGPVLWMHQIKGKGGTVTLNNGTGTSTFPKPARSTTARTLGVVLGTTLPVVSDIVALDMDFNILSPLSKRRSLNFIAQLSWSIL